MTQALINSLNIIQDKTSNLADKMPKTEGLDFGKIFDSKTSKTESLKAGTNSEAKKTNSKNDITSSIQQDRNAKGNNTNAITHEAKSNDTIDNTSKNADTNITCLKFNTDNDNSQTAEDTDTIANAIAEEELNILEEIIITQDTTITEEEPTMYNELTTLEDPTVVLLLQSQIQKTVTNNLDNEQTETTTENENTILKSNTQSLSTTNGKEVFKQFDVQKDTNIVNLMPKEDTHTKSSNSKSSTAISEQIVKELNVEVLSAQSTETESSMGDLMQNQTPQDHTTRLMIQGDVKFDKIAETVKSTSATQVKTSDITPSKIIDQISKQLDGMVNNSKLNMVLNPGTLGKVNLQIINSKIGLMAQFTVTTQDAKDLLLKGLDGLKENLLAQGISVDNVSVKLEESDNDYQFDWTEQEGSRGGNKQQEARKQKDNEKQFEQMMFELENENNV